MLLVREDLGVSSNGGVSSFLNCGGSFSLTQTIPAACRSCARGQDLPVAGMLVFKNAISSAITSPSHDELVLVGSWTGSWITFLFCANG